MCIPNPNQQPQTGNPTPTSIIYILLQVLVLAGLGLGAGVAVGSVGAAIGLASARQEVKWQIYWESVKNCKVVFLLLFM